MITTTIARVARKKGLTFSAGVDLFYNDDSTQQYNVLQKVVHEHRGANPDGRLRKAQQICLRGMLDGESYEVAMTFVVEKHLRPGVSVGRTLTFAVRGNNARGVVQEAFPKRRAKVFKLMKEAFGDFLTPQEYELAYTVYLEEVIGVQ